MNILLHTHSMYISFDALAAISTTVGDFNRSNNDMTYVLGQLQVLHWNPHLARHQNRTQLSRFH